MNWCKIADFSISMSIGFELEIADNGKSSVVPRITCIVFHVTENCWFTVDNTDFTDSIDEDFKMVAISIVSVTVHSATSNLLDSNGAYFVDSESVAIVTKTSLSTNS